MSQSYVLVVDPNPAIHRRVEAALSACDLGLLSARNAEEAEATATGHDLAVVLSATSLPRGNGYDLARLLQERHPAAAVLLMSGGFEVYNQQRAEEAGVVGQLSKPFTSEQLVAAVEQAIGPLPQLPGATGESSERAAVSSVSSARGAPRSDVPPPRPVLPRPLASNERVATILPRDYESVPVVSVDPDLVGPALERAILEVLPEVVEAVLRNALDTSPTFRDLVDAAVAEAVAERLPALVQELVTERLDALEARLSED